MIELGQRWGSQVKWRTISSADVVTQWRAGHVSDQDTAYADQAFGFKWNDALAVSDPEAREFALNALAEIVDREAVTVTYTNYQPYPMTREDMERAIDMARDWAKGSGA